MFFLCEIKCNRVRILCSLHSVYSFIILLFYFNLVNDMWPSAEGLRKRPFPPCLRLLCAVGEADLLCMRLFSDGVLVSPNSTDQSLATCHSSSYSY